MQPVNTIRAVSMRKIGDWRLISNGGNKIEVSSTRGNYAQRVIDFVLLIVEQVIGRETYKLNKELMVNIWGADRSQDKVVKGIAHIRVVVLTDGRTAIT